MDSKRYEKYLVEGKQKFESMCIRCGECCGAFDDPCHNLAEQKDGTYFCREYAIRFGPQQTSSGRQFNCVSIREHIAKSTLRQNCSYRGV